MKTRILGSFLIISLAMVVFVACHKDEEHNKEMVITVASEKLIYDGGIIFSPYWAKTEEYGDKWVTFDGIEGFTHEEGYEYILRVWREKWHNGEVMDAGIYRYKLLDVISRVKKDSEGLPPQVLYLEVVAQKAEDNENQYQARIYGRREWEAYPEIKGFEYTEGFTYLILVKRQFQGSNASPKYTYTYMETLKKTENKNYI